MRIRVDHRDVTWLAVDLTEATIGAKRQMPQIVKKNVRLGRVTEQQIARAASGPHGRDYYKRITSDMTGPLTGEWGPHDGGTPVGAGWRHGINTDSAKSADIIGPAFERDVAQMIDGLFADRHRI